MPACGSRCAFTMLKTSSFALPIGIRTHAAHCRVPTPWSYADTRNILVTPNKIPILFGRGRTGKDKALDDESVNYSHQVRPVLPCSDLAEGVGFEPTKTRQRLGGFQDRCLQPLGHPSSVVYCKGFEAAWPVALSAWLTPLPQPSEHHLDGGSEHRHPA